MTDMTFSMTGFGKSEITLPNKMVSIEVRTLNSKNLELNLRMPSFLRPEEMKFRDLLSKKLIRGKVDISISSKPFENINPVKLNQVTINNYISELKNLVDNKDKNDYELLKIAMTLPDCYSSQEYELTDDDKKLILEGLEGTVNDVLDFRKNEGKSLEKDLVKNLELILNGLEQTKKLDVSRVPKIKEKLKSSLSKLNEEFDQNRFEQELIYYLEKLDINEELVRLESHCNLFIETMSISDPKGRKLNFISQEMNREINTIGSKANDFEVQKTAVQMKDYSEKIKEQLLNIV